MTSKINQKDSKAKDTQTKALEKLQQLQERMPSEKASEKNKNNL